MRKPDAIGIGPQWSEWVVPATTHPIDRRCHDHITVQKSGMNGNAETIEIIIGDAHAVLTNQQAYALRMALRLAGIQDRGGTHSSYAHLVVQTK